MAFQGSGLVLFLLLATVFILGAYAANYKQFLGHHFDYPQTSIAGNYCNGMMSKRGMTRPKCKELNSFIHEPKPKIAAVCTSGGEPYMGGLRRSLKKFTVTSCKMRGSFTRPPCEYRGSTSERFIIIACDKNNQPVHYEEGHI